MIQNYNKQVDKAQYWKSSKYPASFFRLLGCLVNYYAGTYRPKEDIVQLFYGFTPKDEETKSKATMVYQNCIQLLSDIGANNDTQLLIVNKEDTTQFKITSKNVCDYIESIHFNHVNELFLETAETTIDTYPTALLQRFEFIVGAFLYHGSTSGEWVFYNNFEKMKLVYEFMIPLADEDDEITITSSFRTPHVHKIKLNSDGPLRMMIEEELKATYL